MMRSMFLCVMALTTLATAHPDDHPWRPERTLPRTDPFARLDDMELPSPNRFRTASGAPGPDYWQQQVDYTIDVTLNTEAHRIEGSERITYKNNSPDTLHWLWIQLDQNKFKPESRGRMARRAPNLNSGMSFDGLRSQLESEDFPGGVTVQSVTDGNGKALDYIIDDTMMRIDLPTPLAPGRTTKLDIEWSSLVVPDTIGGRSGYEVFDDGRTLYQIAQWFPRLAAYTDYDGWQTRPFLGRGEFTLEFGNYDVNITVPENYLVGATGELQNPREVLTPAQRERFDQARSSTRPVQIVTRGESDALVASPSEQTATWRFSADNVRDFAFSASPAFAWDAMGVPIPGSNHTAMAMSMWPAEGDGLWDKYSTHAVAHALESYSQTAMPYPWPVAWSVNGVVGGGMEYPMMTFNGPRPEDDGTWTERAKYGLISVVIHEVGHFWFPMIVNSDERQWTWMDEGINTYHQFLAERTWEEDYARSRGLPRAITGYMRDVDNSRPIMTASESILQFGANAYAKPATALNILRETVVGRDLFDHAMHAYTDRWAFKRPEPADFFRTIEDASGRDLDWFWRGWFYDTRPVDVSLESVETFRVHSGKPAVEREIDRKDEAKREPETVTAQRNAGKNRRTDRHPELIDFYSTRDKHGVTPADTRAYEKLMAELDEDERALLNTQSRFHVLRFRSNGGLIMPLPIKITYEDDTVEELVLPADLWRSDPRSTSKLLIRDKAIASVTLDPHDELADVDRSDNTYPPTISDGRFRLSGDRYRSNPMRDAANEAARTRTHEAMALWASSLEPKNVQEAVATPMPQDGWNAPVALVIIDNEDVFVRLSSAGPDGVHGTPDDLSATVDRAGVVGSLRTAEEQPDLR